jgi:hypothetical protein
MDFKEDLSWMSARNLAVDYDVAGRCATITLPESVLSGDIPIVVIDNSNWFRGSDDHVLSTTESVDKESSTTLAKKVDLVCPDLYVSINKWEEPITIQVVSNETGSLHERFHIWMEKRDSTLNGYSCWMFRSDKSTCMPIKDGALQLDANGDRADLNLLALMFIFESAGLKVQYSSNDKGDIKSSLTKFRVDQQSATYSNSLNFI